MKRSIASSTFACDSNWPSRVTSQHRHPRADIGVKFGCTASRLGAWQFRLRGQNCIAPEPSASHSGKPCAGYGLTNPHLPSLIYSHLLPRSGGWQLPRTVEKLRLTTSAESVRCISLQPSPAAAAARNMSCSVATTLMRKKGSFWSIQNILAGIVSMLESQKFQRLDAGLHK